MIVFYFLPPFVIPDKYLQQISELIARTNHDTIFDNFELDFFSGRVRLKKVLQWREREIEIDEIKSTLEAGFDTWDKYIPLFQAVLNDEK